MPLPEPKVGESKSDFVSRCMDDPTAKADFPNTNQRVAVCYTQFDSANKRKYYESLEKSK